LTVLYDLIIINFNPPLLKLRRMKGGENIMFGLDSKEIILIAVVLLVLFGSQKLVEFARGLGEAKKELGKVKKELQND